LTADRSWVEFTEPGSYIFQLQVDDGEQAATDQVQVDVLYPTGVPGQNGTVVSGLYGVAPNPVQSRTTISFGVARPQATVKIAVYGVDGRRVATLYDGNADFGVHHIHWGATDSRNASVASGVYFLIADIDGRRSTRKLTVVR